MAGYAAVVSLEQTIERILDSCHFSLVPPSRGIIRVACKQLEPLKRKLERLDSSGISKSRKKVNALDGEIKEAVWRLEDVLETLLSDQILSQSEADVLVFTIDLQSLQPDVVSFIKAVKDLGVKYIYELENMSELEEDELGLSTNYSGGDMVGFQYSCSLEKVKNHLMQKRDENSVLSILGMGGRGKTTLVKKIFEDSQVLTSFEYCVWVSVGRKSQFNEISRAILAQLDPNTHKVGAGDEVNIGMYLKKRMEGKRCLIVLDDVWDAQLLDYLTTSLPDKNSAMIQILVTTRLPTVAEHTFKLKSFCLLHTWGLNEQESKELLRKKVFGEEDFPLQLREAAQKIASNCESLPLMIVTVADLISKANNNHPLYWNEVAERRSSVFMDAYNQISEVLFPTYDVFPQRVKMILIYVGAIPQDYSINVPYLINLLSAERFSELQNLEKNVDQTLNEFGWKCGILDLQKENSHRFFEEIRVYSWWLHLFNREASKDKFLHVLTRGTDFLGGGIKGQRRLCLHSNFLFNFKEVHNSLKCDCASTTRSLLCLGPYHPYSMPLNVGFKLLRVLDAVRVRFYNFPFEILELVLLQYLALTCDGELPTSISKLFNLEFLIIRPHMHIKCCGVPSYMPIEIWDMQELKQIEIVGSNLPNPNSASSLQKLSSLLGVSPDSCTKEVLEKIPNLKQFSIEIQLKPCVDDSNPLCCLDHISTLKNLEILQCAVANPEVKYEFVAPPTPPSLSMFPSSLQKLSLRGLGYSWKHMKAIGSLPKLKVLNLGCNAFRGPKWGTKRMSFLSLKTLVIKDCDMVRWKPGCGSFPKLETVRIAHCYKLKEVYWPSAARCDGRIELNNCHPLAVACAEQSKLRNNQLQVISHFDKKIKP